MFVRWYRRWKERRGKRAAEHYAELSEDQLRALERYHDRGPLGAAKPIPPEMRDTRPP